MLSDQQAALYRRLTMGDAALFAALLSSPRGGSAQSASDLDPRCAALVRVAALIAAGATEPAYLREVQEALALGATPEEVTAVLAAVAPITGSAHIMDAAPKLALALGYDVAAGLEDTDAREHGG